MTSILPVAQWPKEAEKTLCADPRLGKKPAKADPKKAMGAIWRACRPGAQWGLLARAHGMNVDLPEPFSDALYEKLFDLSAAEEAGLAGALAREAPSRLDHQVLEHFVDYWVGRRSLEFAFEACSELVQSGQSPFEQAAPYGFKRLRTRLCAAPAKQRAALIERAQAVRSHSGSAAVAMAYLFPERSDWAAEAMQAELAKEKGPLPAYARRLFHSLTDAGLIARAIARYAREIPDGAPSWEKENLTDWPLDENYWPSLLYYAGDAALPTVVECDEREGFLGTAIALTVTDAPEALRALLRRAAPAREGTSSAALARIVVLRQPALALEILNAADFVPTKEADAASLEALRQAAEQLVHRAADGSAVSGREPAAAGGIPAVLHDARWTEVAKKKKGDALAATKKGKQAEPGEFPDKVIKLPDFWNAKTFPHPELKAGGSLDDQACDNLVRLLAVAAQHEQNPHIEEVRAACTEASLAELAWRLFDTWFRDGRPAAHAYVLPALGWFHDERTPTRVVPHLLTFRQQSNFTRYNQGIELLERMKTAAARAALDGIKQADRAKAQAGYEEKKEQLTSHWHAALGARLQAEPSLSAEAREALERLRSTYEPTRVSVRHPPDHSGASAYYYEVDFLLGSRALQFFVHTDDHEEAPTVGLYRAGNEQRWLVRDDLSANPAELKALRQELDVVALPLDVLLWLLWVATDVRAAGGSSHSVFHLPEDDGTEEPSPRDDGTVPTLLDVPAGLTPEQASSLSFGQAHWWLRVQGGDFIKLPARIRGDRALRLTLDLAPGRYQLGVGTPRDGVRVNLEVKLPE